MNEIQVRQSGEDIKQKLLNKAKNGGTVGRAKLGYINDRKNFDGRLPMNELERALAREFASLRLSPDAIGETKREVTAALNHVLSRHADQRARVQKELKKLDVQEERLVDLAADGALATDKLRVRLRDLQIKSTRSVSASTPRPSSFSSTRSWCSATLTSWPGLTLSSQRQVVP